MFFHYNPMSHEFFMTILSLALDVSTITPLLFHYYPNVIRLIFCYYARVVSHVMPIYTYIYLFSALICV